MSNKTVWVVVVLLVLVGLYYWAQPSATEVVVPPAPTEPVAPVSAEGAAPVTPEAPAAAPVL